MRMRMALAVVFLAINAVAAAPQFFILKAQRLGSVSVLYGLSLN